MVWPCSCRHPCHRVRDSGYPRSAPGSVRALVSVSVSARALAWRSELVLQLGLGLSSVWAPVSRSARLS